MKGDKIVQHCDRQSKKTGLSGNMLPNIKTCDNRWENLRIMALKLLELTQFASPKWITLLSFCKVLGVRCDVDIFKLTAHALSFNREVYGSTMREFSTSSVLWILEDPCCLRGTVPAENNFFYYTFLCNYAYNNYCTE